MTRIFMSNKDITLPPISTSMLGSVSIPMDEGDANTEIGSSTLSKKVLFSNPIVEGPSEDPPTKPTRVIFAIYCAEKRFGIAGCLFHLI